MSVNKFSPEKYYDFKILSEKDASVVGKIRVKPSGIHWAPKGARKWHGVSLAEFAEWIEKAGKRKSK